MNSGQSGGCDCLLHHHLLALLLQVLTLTTFIVSKSLPEQRYHSRAVQIVGPFVIMIYRMIAKDLLRFFVIYLIFIMGFSQAYYIIFQTYDGELNRSISSETHSSQTSYARAIQVSVECASSSCLTTRPSRAFSG